MHFKEYLKRQQILANGFGGYTQKRIANELGIAQSTLACYANGHRVVSLSDLDNIVDYFVKKQVQRATEFLELESDHIDKYIQIYRAYHLMQVHYGCIMANEFWETIHCSLESINEEG